MRRGCAHDDFKGGVAELRSSWLPQGVERESETPKEG